MTIRERIVAFLQRHPEGVDDDALAKALQLKYRQQANSRCRQLEEEGLVVRRHVNGKIHNFWVGNEQASSTRVSSAQTISSVIKSVDIEANIHEYLYGDGTILGVQPSERYASFDYCFNYFQSFWDEGQVEKLVEPQFIQTSCFQLAFYLASWGMYRGSSFLLQKSAKFLEPIVYIAAHAKPLLWEIDADCYSSENIKRLLEFRQTLIEALNPYHPSDILVTKIMLGIFGNVPAFDTNFKKGFGVSTFGQRSLEKVAAFYMNNRSIIEQYRVATLSFETGKPTNRRYTRAKVIDMIFFIKGAKL